MNEKIKITGKIMFQETDPRTESWVVKKLDKNKGEQDYFLSLEIYEIGGIQVRKIKDAFQFFQKRFPKIGFQKETLNDLFVDAKVPPGVFDCIHITLGNFPDFRLNRDTANDVDPQRVCNARKLHNQVVEIEINEDDFELVVKGDITEITLTKGKMATASTVGFNRDAVLNLKPSQEVQDFLKTYSKNVFGDDFELWNSQKQPVPYHVTIAQTNAFTQTVNSIREASNSVETGFNLVR